VTVRTLEGEQNIRVTEGTQSNTMFRLKGKGMPVLGGRGRGDLFVAVNVVTPTNLSKEQRRLLEELASLESNGHQERGIVDKVKDIFTGNS